MKMDDMMDDILKSYDTVFSKYEQYFNGNTSSEESNNLYFSFIPTKEESNNIFFSNCIKCPNSPVNGGSGICNCILGQPHIT